MPMKEYRYIGIKFDPNEDADLLEWIECHENMSECIKEAVRFYFNNNVLNDTACDNDRNCDHCDWIECPEVVK
jgi:hypothetical protein